MTTTTTENLSHRHDYWLAVTVGYVARRRGVRPEELTGRGQGVYVAQVRAEAMRACAELGYSAAAIGRFFDRHHTTVLHHLGRLG